MDPRTGGTGSPYGYPFPLSPSAFAIHQQMAAQMDGRPLEPTRYASPWEPSRLMGVSGGSPLLGDFGRLPLPDAATAAAAYRLNVWEMYRLQALRGMPIDPRGPLSPDFLARQAAGAPPTDMFGIHPASATPSIGLPFTAEGGSRLSTPRPESLSRLGRKRPLSLSPYAADFDLNTVIRMSPSSLLSGGNGSRCSSSASGTYGHLAASALSPSSLMALEHVRVQQQLQQYMQQAHAAQALFPSAFHLTGASQTDDLTELHGKCSPKKDLGHAAMPQPVVSSSVPASPRRKEKVTRESAQSSTGGHEEDDEDLMRSPPVRDEDLEAVETRCRWESCQLEFQCNSALVQHVNQDHLPTNKKQFVCRWTDCVREEKPFKAHYMLVVHMRRHTGEKPHRCKFPNCQKAYSRLENLKTHERSHTGDRPYVCEFPGCTKAFTNASDRAKHQNRTHSNLKPYMCKVPGCSKRYTDPSSLRKHIKTVHGPEYFGNKKHKGNDVPRRHRDDNDAASLHPAYPRHLDDTRSSGKSGSGSEPSTPRGLVKQESMERSPSYSHPSSTFTNCSLDSPLSLPEFHHPSLTMPLRSNEPIAEVDNEMDLDGSLAADIRAAIYGPDILVPSPRMMPPQRRMALKPPPPPMPQAGPINLQDLSQRFTEMHTFPEPHPQYYTPTCERRDSTASVGTFYSSLPSEGMVASRRVSEASLMSPPYDPISVGSSRRSSEPTIVPNRSFYQQKIQMRAQQRWCPPQPAPPANGYHGMRRASEPTGMIAPQRIQPLTRRNLQRHNSTGAGTNQEHLHISDEKIRYLEQLYEQTLAQGHGEDDDVGHDLPVVEQNYPPMGGYVRPPPMYQRSASFSHGHPNPAPEMPRRPSQPPEFYQTNVYQTATLQRQRRGGMGRMPEMGGERRPLAEGSPDSYQVTSTTGMDPSYHVQPNGYEPAGMHGGESSMMMNDMHSLMSNLDYENHLYKMVQ